MDKQKNIKNKGNYDLKKKNLEYPKNQNILGILEYPIGIFLGS